MQTILVTDNQEAWAFLDSMIVMVDASSYLCNQSIYKNQPTRVINLCRFYQYQTIGYYVSLLAEARQHKVLPRITDIQDTLNINLSISVWPDINDDIQRCLSEVQERHITIDIYFNHSVEDKYADLVKVFSQVFPLPLIRIELLKKKIWMIQSIKPLSMQDIPKKNWAEFTQFAYHYFNQNRFNQKYKKHYRLAILTEPNEKTAPSNTKALEKFMSVGEDLGLHVHLITKHDARHLSKYDALFIRATTSVNHYTYQMARQAARNDLIVIDDPQSIVRCTNKIYLSELFGKHHILTPPTYFISKYDTTLPEIDFPCVLKKPDGSCSKGVIKIDNLSSLKKGLINFFKTSEMLLVQSFITTAFDWRIGVIDGKPLYACRYYMAKDHWQIVNWNCAIEDDIFIHDTVSLEEVPQAVIQLALKATASIGNSLYGVDIKSVGKRHYVIEVNDNPSINFGIEDKVLQDTLYEKIMSVFLHRLNRFELS